MIKSVFFSMLAAATVAFTTGNAALTITEPAKLFPVEVQTKKDHPLCNVCFQLTGGALQELLNYILNAGVVGG